MPTYFPSLAAAALLFGLSTYFGVFVLETLIQKREASRQVHSESASFLRAQGLWLAPASWILLVFVMAFSIGVFIANATPKEASLSRIDLHELSRPDL